jgi:hypothetical protein
VSVRLLKGDFSFAFAFACDSCERPQVVALLLPDGWEAKRGANGALRHTCPGCRFTAIVEELGWRAA